MHDYWRQCGYALLDHTADGHLVVTDAFLRSLLERPELAPVPQSCAGELALHQALVDQPAALSGLREVLKRAHCAAGFSLAFAVHRHDHDAALLHEAALLHDFAEMLLWVHAPALALALQKRQRAEPGLRSTEAQLSLLQIKLADLQQALMKTWRLPALLVQISDDHSSPLAQVRNVQLAIRLARHSADGWDNPALPDDVDEIAALLNLGVTPTLNLLHDLSD